MNWEKGFKIVLITGLFIPLSGFIWLSTANGSEIISQTATSTAGSVAYQKTSLEYDGWSQGFTLDGDTTFSSADFWINATPSCTSGSFYYSFYSVASTSAPMTPITYFSTSTINCADLVVGKNTIDFPDFTLSAGAYAFEFSPRSSMNGANANSNGFTIGIQNPSTLYSGGANEGWYKSSGGGYTKTSIGVYGDQYFILYGEEESSINIIYPENATSTQDFPNFYVDYNLTTTTATTNLVCVEYFADYEITHHTDCETIGSGISSDSFFAVTKTIPYSYLGTIYAEATIRGNTYTDLYNYNQTIFATSSQISWENTGENTGSFYEEPNATSTISESTINCSGYGVVGNSLCYVFKFLFVPTPTVLDAWNGLWNTIKSKPPIGYFSLFVAEISNLNSSSSPAYEMADVSGISFFHDLRIGLGFVFSLVLLFYVVHRFKTVKI